MNAIRLWCGEHDVLCFRCNVGKVKTETGVWFDTGLPEGFPDLLIFPGKGIVICCEAKTLKGKQRDAQINFQRVVEEKGYTYIVARSVEDVKKIVAPLL